MKILGSKKLLWKEILRFVIFSLLFHSPFKFKILHVLQIVLSFYALTQTELWTFGGKIAFAVLLL